MMENVWDYPRPPALERVSKPIRIVFSGQTIAETSAAWRVLETSHPPVYYLPPDAFSPGALQPATGGSFCEWKGEAVYWTIAAGEKRAIRAGWSYPDPTPRFVPIRDHIAVYAGKMDACFVANEQVTPQPGGFLRRLDHVGFERPVQGRAGEYGVVVSQIGRRCFNHP